MGRFRGLSLFDSMYVLGCLFVLFVLLRTRKCSWVPLESLKGGVQGGLIVFSPMVQELLTIE
jgi:hypothetical protein